MNSDVNKEVVRRFNLEVIQEGNRAAFEELMAADFVNRSTPPGAPNGSHSMWHTFQNVLRPGLADVRVIIQDQVAEGDKVTTRKTIVGRDDGAFFGIAPTHRRVEIEVIDIVRIDNGRYAEHWGVNNLGAVLATLKEP